MANKYVKKSMDSNFINKENYKNKEKLSFDEWKERLFNYCDKNTTSVINADL